MEFALNGAPIFYGFQIPETKTFKSGVTFFLKYIFPLRAHSLWMTRHKYTIIFFEDPTQDNIIIKIIYIQEITMNYTIQPVLKVKTKKWQATIETPKKLYYRLWNNITYQNILFNSLGRRVGQCSAGEGMKGRPRREGRKACAWWHAYTNVADERWHLKGVLMSCKDNLIVHFKHEMFLIEIIGTTSFQYQLMVYFKRSSFTSASALYNIYVQYHGK